jgi:hypothetical protein
MNKAVVLTYTGNAQAGSDSLLNDFRGAKTRSGHMTRYVAYHGSMNVFKLISRDRYNEFRERFRSDSSYRFYNSLIHYPVLQNFLMQKFFPQNHLENFIQLHCLREIKIQPLQLSEKEKDKKEVYWEHKRRFHDPKEVFRKVTLFDIDLRELDQFQESYFPRALSHQECERDFVKNHAVTTDHETSENFEEDSQMSRRMKQIYDGLHIESQMTKVIYRQVRYNFQYVSKDNLRVDIGITWLLLFLGTLKYNVDPYQIAELAGAGITAKDMSYKPPQYYRC